ncbi:MAG: VWA domain-containing protein [Arachnia sp.]
MALTQPWAALAATMVLLLVGAIALVRRPAARRDAGAPISGADRLRSLPRFRALAARRARALLVQVAGLSLAATGALLAVARPVEPLSSAERTTNRDIVLCLDVSGSMAEVDRQVVDAYLALAQRLDGQRIAFVAFDASAVTVFPLTDDAAFITEQLTEAKGWLDGRVVPGTEIGEGTSLIGDGLTSCLSRFDVPEENRSRTVVLATDNQVAGRPLFTLDQAVGRAVERNALVYGIAPADNTPSVTRQLAEALRLTGGDVLSLGPASDVGAIEAAVTAQEARALVAAPRAHAADLVWPAALLMAAGIALTAVGWRLGSWWRRLLVLLLAAAMALLPRPAPGAGAAPPTGLDVLLIIDRTTSMGATDWAGSRPRMDGVAADVAELVARLGPARYAAIASDNVARISAPWTTDASAIVSLARTVGWREEAYGSGSDIAASAGLAQQVLADDAAARPDATRLVVYLGDGEQTADDAPGSFAGLRGLADHALVLGYGTQAGATMRASPLTDGLVERDGQPQLSHIDESALRRVATELGGSYEHRASPGPFTAALPAPSPAVVRDEGLDAASFAWLLGLAALVPLGWELFGALRRWRAAREEVPR